MGETSYQITRIEPQKHREDRVNVYLDGAFAFGLDQEVVCEHHLHQGDTLTESLIDGVLLAEERTKAKQKVLDWLSRRSRSVSEIRRRLREKGVSERTSGKVIDDFLRVGLLDDEKYAFTYVQSRMQQRPSGKRLLRMELLKKGIEEDLAAKAIEEGYGNGSELEVARGLFRRRVNRYHGETRVMKKKSADFLLRRGFSWEVIDAVLQEHTWEEEM